MIKQPLRNNILSYEKITIFQNKHNAVKKMALFLYFVSLLLVRFRWRQQDSHICFCIQSVANTFGQDIFRKSSLIQMYSWKWRYISLVLSSNCGYSFLILYQNSKCYFFKLLYVGLSSSLNGSLAPVHYVSSYLMVTLIIWKILVHWVMQIFRMST